MGSLQAMQETRVCPWSGRSPRVEMTACSSILGLKTPMDRGDGGLQTTELHSLDMLEQLSANTCVMFSQQDFLKFSFLLYTDYVLKLHLLQFTYS